MGFKELNTPATAIFPLINYISVILKTQIYLSSNLCMWTVVARNLKTVLQSRFKKLFGFRVARVFVCVCG